MAISPRDVKRLLILRLFEITSDGQSIRSSEDILALLRRKVDVDPKEIQVLHDMLREYIPDPEKARGDISLGTYRERLPNVKLNVMNSMLRVATRIHYGEPRKMHIEEFPKTLRPALQKLVPHRFYGGPFVQRPFGRPPRPYPNRRRPRTH